MGFVELSALATLVFFLSGENLEPRQKNGKLLMRRRDGHDKVWGMTPPPDFRIAEGARKASPIRDYVLKTESRSGHVT